VSKPLFPIYTYEENDKLPESGTYYVIAKNGIFLHKDTGIVKGLVKVDRVPTLAELEPGIAMNLPKIPGEILYQALMFFRRVWYQYKGEAEVNILYRKADKKYKLVARKQEVSGGGVNYSPRVDGQEDPAELEFYSEQRRQGWLRVGTIHSHCDFGAFHSGTDTHDEAHQDGVHITCGHVNRKYFSMVASLVCNDNRFPVDPEEVILNIEAKSDDGGSKYSGWMGYRQPANYYDFTFSDEETDALNKLLLPVIVKEWMPLVSERNWSRSGGGWWQDSGNSGSRRTITVPVTDKVSSNPDKIIAGASWTCPHCQCENKSSRIFNEAGGPVTRCVQCNKSINDPKVPLDGAVILPTPAPGPGTNSPAPTTEGLDQPSLFPEGAWQGDETPTPTQEELMKAVNLPIAVAVCVKEEMLGCISTVAEKLMAVGMTEMETLPAIGLITGKLPLAKLDDAKAVEGVEHLEPQVDNTIQEPTNGLSLVTAEAVRATAELATAVAELAPVVQALTKEEKEEREKHLWRVRGAAHALRSSTVEIPQDRKTLLLDVLKKHFGKDTITDEDLEAASNLDPRKE
jgi:proteasome lid subunit RPN8/RPN11